MNCARCWTTTSSCRSGRRRGRFSHLSRGSTYTAAEKGEIETVDFGRLKRVPTAWLRRKLGLGKSA